MPTALLARFHPREGEHIVNVTAAICVPDLDAMMAWRRATLSRTASLKRRGGRETSRTPVATAAINVIITSGDRIEPHLK
jgi:hypothetical protein